MDVGKERNKLLSYGVENRGAAFKKSPSLSLIVSLRSNKRNICCVCVVVLLSVLRCFVRSVCEQKSHIAKLLLYWPMRRESRTSM